MGGRTEHAKLWWVGMGPRALTGLGKSKHIEVSRTRQFVIHWTKNRKGREWLARSANGCIKAKWRVSLKNSLRRDM